MPSKDLYTVTLSADAYELIDMIARNCKPVQTPDDILYLAVMDLAEKVAKHLEKVSTPDVPV